MNNLAMPCLGRRLIAYSDAVLGLTFIAIACAPFKRFECVRQRCGVAEQLGAGRRRVRLSRGARRRFDAGPAEDLVVVLDPQIFLPLPYVPGTASIRGYPG